MKKGLTGNYWPEEYHNYQQEVLSFAQAELQDALSYRDTKGIFPHDLWKKCADFGILGLAAPKKYGGTFESVDIIRSTLAMEAIGYACKDNGLGLAINAHMWTVLMTIAEFGTEAQKQALIPNLANGKWIGAHALTEENAGSDVFSMETIAAKTDGGYILNGKKRLITLGPIADFLLIFANARPDKGRWGVTGFMLQSDADGLVQKEVQAKMGLRTVPIGELELNDVFVPNEAVLGKEGSGFSITQASLEYDRCCILAGHLGAMQRQLEDAVAFAKKRKQFGQRISKFQSISNRIADMQLRLETARLLLYRLASLKSKGKSAMLEAAMLKLHLSESFVTSSLDVIRIYGGIGYLQETEVERDLRDAVGGVIYAGTSDIQRNIIAKQLGL